MATVTKRKPVAAAVASASASGTSQDDSLNVDKILGGDFGGGEGQVVNMRTREVVQNARLRQQAGELADQALDIEEMTAEEKAAARQKILLARIEEMRQALPDDKKALGALVSTLNTSFQELKEGFAKVAEYNEGEQKVLANAEKAHEEAAAELKQAEQQVEGAQNKWRIFGIRNRAITNTQAALVAAQEAEQVAKTAIEVATATAQKMRDERLQGADFEDSFKFIEACVKQTKIAILERITNLELQSTEAQDKKVKSFERKQTAAKGMEELQVKVDELASRLQQESETRDQLPAGSSERVEADQKVSKTQREYEETRSSHDQRLAVYQEMEKAVKALEIQETALRVGLHAHKVELARLVAGSDVWVVEARNRIAEIKSLASQQASKDLIEVNVAVRKDNVRNSAAFALASLRLVTEQAERHPNEMADLDLFGNSMGEGLREFADRWKAVDDKIKAAEGGTPPQG